MHKKKVDNQIRNTSEPFVIGVVKEIKIYQQVFRNWFHRGSKFNTSCSIKLVATIFLPTTKYILLLMYIYKYVQPSVSQWEACLRNNAVIKRRSRIITLSWGGVIGKVLVRRTNQVGSLIWVQWIVEGWNDNEMDDALLKEWNACCVRVDDLI